MTAYELAHQNTAGLHYDGPDNNGVHIVLDAAEIRPGFFEVAAVRVNGHEIETHTADSITAARQLYHEMFKRRIQPHYVAPLSGKYAKLRDDLRAALEAGRAAEETNPEDGGTCNFDSAALRLPRWIEKQVERAAKEAGTTCFAWHPFHTKLYVFRPDTSAQANARSRNAEAMTKALQDMGYDAMDYCQAD